MATVRQVADRLGIPSGEVLRRLEELGVYGARDDSTVDDVVAGRIESHAPGAARTTPLRRIPPPPPPPRAAVPGASSNGGRQAPASGATTVLPTAVPGRLTAERDSSADGPAAAASVGEARTAPRVGAPERAQSRWLSQVAELPLLVLLAFVIAVLIKTFLVQAFYIPSASMFPTLRIGDRVLVEKISYRLRDPEAADVVVFAKSVFGSKEPELPWYEDVRTFMRELLGLPTGTEQDYIKRVVAVGGDSVRYAGKPRHLVVNGRRIDEPYIKGDADRYSPSLTARDCKRLDMARAGKGCRVPDGKVFVMGDNRGNSEDSRAIGPIEEDKIVGHAFVIIWPPGDFRGL
jgi:signal peptidase I